MKFGSGKVNLSIGIKRDLNDTHGLNCVAVPHWYQPVTKDGAVLKINEAAGEEY